MTINNLPSTLYHRQAVRLLDQIAIQQFNIPGFTLMRRAGRAAFHTLQHQWPDCRALSVFTGGGNNGGDGFIVAGLAKLAGFDVQLIMLVDSSNLAGDAKAAFTWAVEQGVKPIGYEPNIAVTGDVIVDALLGTGLNKTVKEPYSSAIDHINQLKKPILAIDIPSGLDCDTGTKLGSCIKACVTITFIGLKIGLMTHDGPEQAGLLVFNALSIPDEVYKTVEAQAKHLTIDHVHKLPKRKRNAHKGDFGHVLVIGGDYGFGGAVIMAAKAAARSGAGLTSVITQSEHVTPLLASQPEIMAHSFSNLSDLNSLFEKATVIVLGPGLGQSDWSKQLFKQAIATDKPLVIDADGLNLLTIFSNEISLNPMQAILTPHPGEAARLLKTNTPAIQKDRIQSAKSLFATFNQTIVLKGCGTIICAGDDSEHLSVCSAGNPGMASGGMGDVLSGVIGGLLAQGLTHFDAACLGVCLHAEAADRAAKQKGERGLLATDLLDYIQQLNNE